MVDSATTSIDISTFKAEFTTKHRGRHLRAFFDKVFEKRAAGIRVRFLLNWNDQRRMVPSTNKSAISHLKAHKIDVRVLRLSRCCHSKIILVDSHKCILGSHNLSVSSCHRNFEASWLVYGHLVCRPFQELYDHTFRDAVTP